MAHNFQNFQHKATQFQAVNSSKQRFKHGKSITRIFYMQEIGTFFSLLSSKFSFPLKVALV